MRNIDKINNMDKPEMASFLKSFSKICAFPEYADIELWLDEEQEDMVYIGTKTRFQGKPATLVDRTTIFGKPYDVLICENEIIKVPHLKK